MTDSIPQTFYLCKSPIMLKVSAFIEGSSNIKNYYSNIISIVLQ